LEGKIVPDRSDFELLSLIKRLAVLLQQNIDLWLKPYDLARSQYAVLHNLKGEESIPAGKLAALMLVEPATMSGLIDTLEAKGLVKRLEQTGDKRRKYVQLTPAGRELVATIPPPGPVMERSLRSGIDAEEVNTMKAVGHQMILNLESELRKQETNKSAGEV
jgi:DNA-binding MarR family transcriptional regulator